MAREFFEHDPLTGITYYTDYDEQTGKMYLRKEENVEPFLDHLKATRNEKIYSPKADMFHYASIPLTVYLEMRNKGIDVLSRDPDMLKRVKQEIETNYPYLKTADARI